MSIAGVVTRGYGGTNHQVNEVAARGYANYTGLPMPPPTGYEYLTSTTIYSGAGYSLEQGSSPAIVVGDVFITQKTTTPSGYVITIEGDGTIIITAHGDNSRQSFLYEIYRVASNAIDGPATVWINEVAPIWGGPVIINPQIVSTPITALNLAVSPYAVSPSGDVLTFALASGALPAGVTLTSAGILSGTPTVAGSFNFTISATDSTGMASISPTGLIFVVVPSYISVIVPSNVISAWTADSAIVTADSINFTCDGADLINGGGYAEAETKGPARNVSQYLRF